MDQIKEETADQARLRATATNLMRERGQENDHPHPWRWTNGFLYDANDSLLAMEDGDKGSYPMDEPPSNRYAAPPGYPFWV